MKRVNCGHLEEGCLRQKETEGGRVLVLGMFEEQ